jgi:hypothetical protein
MTLALLRVFLPQSRKPGSGHSLIDQATALSQPSFFKQYRMNISNGIALLRQRAPLVKFLLQLSSSINMNKRYILHDGLLRHQDLVVPLLDNLRSGTRTSFFLTEQKSPNSFVKSENEYNAPTIQGRIRVGSVS